MKKLCVKCNISQSILNFHKKKDSPDGLRAACKSCRSIERKQYHFVNRDLENAKNKAWSVKNKDKIKIKDALWNLKNKDYVNFKQRVRYKNSIEYRIRQNIRSRIKDSIKKDLNTPEYVGCSIVELKIHLESKFLPGMTWDNYGFRGWHIDHIKPLANFDLTDREELLMVCHYTNLQPLWWQDNLSKGDKCG
jgi:hypothetical protein